MRKLIRQMIDCALLFLLGIVFDNNIGIKDWIYFYFTWTILIIMCWLGKIDMEI